MVCCAWIALPAIADAGAPTAQMRRGFHRASCPGPFPARTAHCHTQIATTAAGTPLETSDAAVDPAAGPGQAPAGYGPQDLWNAYGVALGGDGLPAGGAGKTIAIVVAFNAPTAEADLATYRDQFGLPACTTANGCFRKVNQDGVAGSYPPDSSAWAQEAALDLDMASAICPQCDLLLVEADSAGLTDLGAAVDRAAKLGATQISNSFGGQEFSSEGSYEHFWDHPGIDVTVSSGDSGFIGGYRVPGVLALRHDGRRHDADARRRGPARLARSRLVGCRERVLEVHPEARVAG